MNEALSMAMTVGAAGVVVTVLAVAREVRIHWRLAGAWMSDRETGAAIEATQLAQVITLSPAAAIAAHQVVAA